MISGYSPSGNHRIYSNIVHPGFKRFSSGNQSRFTNPLITPLDEATEDGWEGCLSVPGLRGLVPRYRAIRYQGYDENGQPIDRTVSGFHARVVQHECDHLQGMLYPMRMRDFTKFGFTDVLFPGLD